MIRKIVSAIMSILLVLSMLSLMSYIQPVKASGTIYINPDGSVTGTTYIQTVDNITYLFTGNIIGETIIVLRNNIVIDGNGYTLQGNYNWDTGLILTGMTNVTVQNVNITNYFVGIGLGNSYGNTLARNHITSSSYDITGSNSSSNSVFGNDMSSYYEGIKLDSSSNYNIVSGNNIRDSSADIVIISSSSNSVFGNNITTPRSYGIILQSSSDTVVSGNNISNNYYGVRFISSSSFDNVLYHNNFVGNIQQVLDEGGSMNFWDDGYPSGGNYWSDYTGVDVKSGPYQNVTGSDGIGDTPYAIDSNNTDTLSAYATLGSIYEWDHLH